MRIPTYSSERGISAPQISTPRVPEPLNLSKAIDVFEGIYKTERAEQEDAYNVYVAGQKQRTLLDLDTKYAELSERIANGDDYGTVEKEFQSYYDKITKQSFGRFKNDKLTANKLGLDYQRVGVEYGLRLKKGVSDRARSDTLDIANVRLADISNKLSNVKSNAELNLFIDKATDILSELTVSNIISEAEAQKNIQGMLDKGVFEQASTNPIEFLNDLKQNPKRYKGVTNLDKIEKYAKEQSSLFIKEGILNETINEIQNNSSLAQRLRAGKPTQEDLNQIDNPLIKAYLGEKRKIPDMERVEVLNELQKRAIGLGVHKITKKGGLPEHMQTEEGFSKAIKEIRKFQEDVLEAEARGVFSRRDSAQTMHKSAEQLISSYKIALEEPGKQFRDLMPGVQNIERYVTEFANTIGEGVALTGMQDWEAKVEFRDAVMKSLSNYKSSGNTKKDEEKIYGVMKDVLHKMVVESYPQLGASPILREADRIIMDDGEINLSPDKAIVDSMTEKEIEEIEKETEEIEKEIEEIDASLKQLGG